jgi:hypothetical protein
MPKKTGKYCNTDLIITVSAILLLQGCANQGYSVLASTGTVIGVEVSQNPATQVPQAKLGYNRAELAFVPTNRNAEPNAGNTQQGARDAANVIMELRYGGIFDTGKSSGIYQRVAVGNIAVQQPGAAAMFIKNAEGDVDQKAAEAIKSIPLIQPSWEKKKQPIALKLLELQSDKPSLDKFNQAAQAVGYQNIEAVMIDPNPAPEKIDVICKSLHIQGIDLNCP